MGSPTLNRAVVLSAPGRLDYLERSVPRPGAGEVLVRVRAAALCSTDIELASGIVAWARLPLVPGHETTGVIVEVGDGVPSSRVGEPVAIQGVVGCGHCPPCLAGRIEFCRTAYDEIGFTRDGGWADYLAVPSPNAVRVPDHWSPELGALLEPFSCCFGAVADEDVAGRDVAVIGTGPAAFYFILSLRGLGAGRITAHMKRLDRADLAREMGADAVVGEAPSGPGYDLVVDAVGSDTSLRQAIAGCQPGGRVVLYGLRDETAAISVHDVVMRTITIAGKSARPDLWPRAIEAVDAAAASPIRLLTRRVSMEDIPGIVSAHLAGTAREFKVVALNTSDRDD
jgi:threonine dehydrogenase-like Zn-dependent dehydrogenase